MAEEGWETGKQMGLSARDPCMRGSLRTRQCSGLERYGGGLYGDSGKHRMQRQEISLYQGFFSRLH
jgi:hypothetical protein